MPSVPAHIKGTVIRLEKCAGDAITAGETILVLGSARMEVPVESPVDGRVREIRVKEGQAVAEGDVLAVVE
jgi:acetyl-CoA carboxylase biotin carboxyl carrier protein